MQNLEKLEKSKGVVLFAFNTEAVDYVAIADKTSKLIAHNLRLPVTLITDKNSKPEFAYNSIVRIDNTGSNHRLDLDKKLVTWRNFGRYLAYELSPYDETILIDTDYLVLDNSLNWLFSTDFDYKLMHHNSNEAGLVYEQMGETSLPYVWATVVLFRKTEKTRLFFNLIGRIQRNYRYYCSLFNVREGNYRNDYAFAMANIIINGYSINESQGIPWCMFTVDDKIEKLVPADKLIKVHFEKTALVVPYQNIHVMDKKYLQSADFAHFVETICEST